LARLESTEGGKGEKVELVRVEANEEGREGRFLRLTGKLESESSGVHESGKPGERVEEDHESGLQGESFVDRDVDLGFS